jgi:type VI protein secretion system component Hcp
MSKKKSYLLVIMTVLLLAIGSSATAVAATTTVDQPALNYDVYMKLDGICGESKADKFANWIELTGVEFNVANSAASAQGGGGAAGKAEMTPITVSKKYYDCSSIPLSMNSLSGKHIKNGQIAFVTKNIEQPITILKIDLTDVVIAEYHFNNMYETVALSAGSIDFNYTVRDEKGGKKLPIQGGWDFKANKMK